MHKLAPTAAFALLLATSACGRSFGPAYGDFTSIIAVMSPSLWDEVGEDVYDALEPTIETVRTEKTFNVTYQDPDKAEWKNLRRFRQLLLVGTGDEAWIQDAIRRVQGGISGPGVYHAYDIWGRGQQATIIIAPANEEAAAVRSHLADINGTLDHQFREYARARMFMSGTDTALADSLDHVARFRLVLPAVYRWERTDSIYTFRNDNPDPSELIRQITVAWRSPITASFAPKDLLDWRAEVAQTYNEPQQLDLSNSDTTTYEIQGHPALQIQGLWKNPPDLDWPAAGPFITRSVVCPQQDRRYLLDAWLYAPSKDKYEYMIQLQTILDSFACGAS